MLTLSRFFNFIHTSAPFRFLLTALLLGYKKEALVASNTKKHKRMPKYYHDDPEWADLEPLPQDDGSLHPLAAIAYTDEYSESMGYLRAAMAKNEFSDRILGLTEHIISMNPAHYTVWLYRAKTIAQLGKPLRDEIEWLNPTALRYLKNYQIWHHRQTIIDALDSPDGEAEFINSMLEQDSKNYHVWSYRQWIVKRFNLFEKPEELEWTNDMIEADVRNNSAWNHRFYLVAGGRGSGQDVGEEIIAREIDYAKRAIRRAPQNQSPWNYLRGIVRHAKMPVSTLKEFALEFADLRRSDDIYSTHGLDLLADIYAEEKESKKEAREALELLATKYDPIRAQYWNYRKGQLDQAEVSAF